MDKLTGKQLDLLIELTDIKSESVIRALHLHLIENKSQIEAAETVGITQGVVSKRLKAIKDADCIARKLSDYYLLERLLPLIDSEVLTDLLKKR